MPRPMHQALFFGIVAVLWIGLHLYLYHRVAAAFDLGSRARLVFKVALPVMASWYLLGRLLQTRVDADLGTVVLWPGALYLGFFSVGVSLLLLYDLGFHGPCRLLVRLGLVSNPDAFDLQPISRYAIGVIGSLTLAVGGYGVFEAWRGPSVRSFEVSLRGLPRAMDGVRVVQASDLHVGGLVTRAYLDRVLELVSSLEPDLLVWTGDLTDEKDGGDGEVLSRIASIRARLGVFVVMGNHEYYVGASRTVAAFERAGFTVLRQDHREVGDGLIVAGVDDPSFLGGRENAAEAVRAALRDVPEDRPAILLSHQPVAIEEAAAAGVDLMLCGHTHGGQVFPFHVVSRLAYGVLTGMHRIGDMTLILSNGAGFWGPPMRILAPPDVVVVTLRRAD